MGRRWPALDVDLQPGYAQDLVLAELDAFQPTAIQEFDDTRRMRAFFATAETRDAAAGMVAARFGSAHIIHPVEVDDEDWAARSQAELRSITVGRVTIAPPWDVPPTPSGDQAVVIIEPSMGFGTGHHATTRLVLAALQEIPLEGKAVLDVGCGSGVLALAAVKLGATEAMGIDIDPDALANARDNLVLNASRDPSDRDRVRFELADFRRRSPTADIVLANLTGGLVEQSAECLTKLVEPGGYLLVSGFTSDEKPRVSAALERFVRVERIDDEGGWMCATCSQVAPDVPHDRERRRARGVGA